MLDIQVLPQLVSRLGARALRLQNATHGIGEGTVEEHVAQHVPGVLSANLHIDDAVVGTGRHAPFFRRTLRPLRGVIRLPHVGLKRVLGKVVVG